MGKAMYYDIRKRRTFQTVGELRALLNHLPAHTRVVICGDLNCFYHEDEDGRTVCLDSEDLADQYEEAMEYMLAKETPEERDSHLVSLWHELADVPMDPETETIEAPFYIFDAGTHREDIWQWFDKHYSKGVASLLREDAPAPQVEETPLSQFIRQEVPCRLVEVLGIPVEKVTAEVLRACVDLLESDTSILFDYDRIDQTLLEVLKEHGICGGDA